MDKWEYNFCTTTTIKTKELIKRLNEEGKDGWELVQILKEGMMLTAIFKRKINE